VVLYLSRVHYKKGILRLLKAWSEVARNCKTPIYWLPGRITRTPWRARGKSRQLLHYGFRHVLRDHQRRTENGRSLRARYLCLPSHSEGLSVAALEALSIGLPVVLTPECNVDGVAEYGAGAVTSNNPAELADVLSQCLRMNGSQWNDMSRSAVRLARERFDWAESPKACARLIRGCWAAPAELRGVDSGLYKLHG